MNCSNCGLKLEGVMSATCPRCGQPIAATNPFDQPFTGYPATPPGDERPAPVGYEQSGGYGSTPMPPPPPAPRRRASRGLVRIITLVVVLACIGIVALVAASANQVKQSPLSGVTATVTGKLIYRQSFTSSTNTIATDSDCRFANGGFQVSNSLNCFTNLPDQSNATITLQTKQSTGDEQHYYGIDFRRISKGNFYTFRIDSSGDWIAAKYVNATPTEFGSPGTSLAMETGYNTVNTLQVHMNGSHFDFSINGVMVGSADDATFAKGKIGVGVESSVTCVFNNLEVTTP